MNPPNPDPEDLPVRKKLAHAVPQWVPEGSWFFITIKCVPPGKNQLCQTDDGQVGRVTPCAPLPPHNPTARSGVTRPTHQTSPPTIQVGRAVLCPPSPESPTPGAHGVTRPTIPTLVGRAVLCQPLPPHNPTARSGVTRPTIGDAVLAAMAHNHTKLVWHCRLCLLMPDHLHAIIAFPREPGMKTLLTNWKKFVAVKQGVDWQRDFFDHRLRDHHELAEKTSYILMNPVRKGLCERMEDWPWVYQPNDRPPPTLG